MSFEKIAAVYVYCMNYHTGQWSREYRILSRISHQYKLRLSDSAIRQIEIHDGDESEWLESNIIYWDLIRNHQLEIK